MNDRAAQSDYFALAWAKTANVEKGYVFDPLDPGGETNWGITIKVARAGGYTGAMRDMPREVAIQIGKHEFWDKLRLDEIARISPDVAFELFDTNMNLWAGAAAGWFQSALNALNLDQGPDVPVDGLIGTRTIAMFAAYMAARGKDGGLVMLRCLNSLQCADYIRQANSVPSKRRFTFGWVLKRVYIETPAAV